MSHSLDSKTGADGPVTVIKSYTVPADEADCFTEAYQDNTPAAFAHACTAPGRRP